MACGRGCSSGGICLQTTLPAIAPSGKSRARRFGGREHVADGNGRRCRFTPVVSCIRRHFRLTTEAKKRKNDKTVSAVQHKHIKEVPTTMAVSLVTLWSSWAFLCLWLFFACAASEMGLRTSSRKPFSEQGNGKIPKKSVMIWRYGRKKVSLQVRKSCLKL